MRLAKGTRAKIIHPFFNCDRIGDVFEVAECNSESITLNRCYSDSRSCLQASYTLPTDEFGVFFEIIGMEEPKKTSDDRVITLSLSEDELDALWAKSTSFEHFKEKLKLAAKKKDKPPKVDPVDYSSAHWFHLFGKPSNREVGKGKGRVLRFCRYCVLQSGRCLGS